MEAKLKKGDAVKIFTDPITRKKPEGDAILIKKLAGRENQPLNYWTVKFVSDGYVCERFIRNPKYFEK